MLWIAITSRVNVNEVQFQATGQRRKTKGTKNHCH
jgi:hypothetical protein